MRATPAGPRLSSEGATQDSPRRSEAELWVDAAPKILQPWKGDTAFNVIGPLRTNAVPHFQGFALVAAFLTWLRLANQSVEAAQKRGRAGVVKGLICAAATMAAALLCAGCSQNNPEPPADLAQSEPAAPVPNVSQPQPEQPPKPNPNDARWHELRPLFDRLNSRRTRDEAFAELGRLVTGDDGPVLLKAFDNTASSSARWRILAIIKYVQAKGTAHRIREILQNSESHHVRRNAAHALGGVGTEADVEDLVTAALEDEEFSVRRASAAAIYEIMGSDGRDPLRKILETTDDGGLRVAIKWMLDDRFKGTVDPEGGAADIIDASYEGTHYKLYLPSRYRRGAQLPLLVSVHGTDGVPGRYLRMWIADAERHGFAVLAPHFDTPTFPFYDLLDIGLGGTFADKRLLAIIDQVERHLSVRTDRFYLFGHSKGGQFVTRFALVHPGRIIAAAACGSGHYVRWIPDGYFPGGTAPHPHAPEMDLDFGDLVRMKLAVVLGTRELDRRKQAAEEFMDDVRRYAAEHRIESSVEMIWVPNGGHNGRTNQPKASQFFFGG